MLLSENSDIITDYKPAWLTGPAPIDVLNLKGDKVLALSATAMSLYSSESAIQDELGNGLLASIDWQEPLHFEDGFVTGFKAGAIFLHQGKTLLITPVAIQLFATANDALSNKNCLASLPLPSN